MIPNAKVLDILSRLLEKTRLNQVNWKPEYETADEPTFVVYFPNSELYLTHHEPGSEVEHIEVLIRNSDNSTIAPSTPVARMVVGQGDREWDLVSSLFLEASRTATGWPQVLDEIEHAIGNPGQIGLDL